MAQNGEEAKWLPDLDSNQDKLNQNQLCYHYTIGQNLIMHLIYSAFVFCQIKI